MGLGATELIVIAAVIIFLFGAKKLPGLARGIGQSIKEFKSGVREPETPEKRKATLEK